MMVGVHVALLLSVVSASLVLGTLSNAHAAQASLIWDYTAPGAAGFALYCGTSSGNYVNRYDVGNMTSYTITGFADGATYFCSAVAYDASKQESPYSNEVRIDTPPASTGPAPPPTSGPPPAATCPCTIWAGTAVPTQPGFPEQRALELGVKFRADVSGRISGIRFFKSTMNTGAHVGSLWGSDGVLLAQAAFNNETASGWQQVNFAIPVPIAAGTIYVASYHTNAGYYAGDNGYFAAGVDAGPLHALQDGVSGGNGIYAYSTDTVFPTKTYKATNYWVDVVFDAK